MLRWVGGSRRTWRFCWPEWAVPALAFGASGTFVFVAAMIAGMLLHGLVTRPR